MKIIRGSKIIVVTSDKSMEKDAIEAGVSAFLLKPVTIKELIHTIEKISCIRNDNCKNKINESILYM